MSEIELSKDQYAMVIRLIKKTHCDYTHALRVLNDKGWKEEISEKQIVQERTDFAQGKIRFGPGKEIIPVDAANR